MLLRLQLRLYLYFIYESSSEPKSLLVAYKSQHGAPQTSYSCPWSGEDRSFPAVEKYENSPSAQFINKSHFTSIKQTGLPCSVESFLSVSFSYFRKMFVISSLRSILMCGMSWETTVWCTRPPGASPRSNPSCSRGRDTQTSSATRYTHQPTQTEGFRPMLSWWFKW